MTERRFFVLGQESRRIKREEGRREGEGGDSDVYIFQLFKLVELW